MKTQLSSSLTFGYKVFGIFWGLITILLFLIITIGTKDPLGLVMLLMLLPSIVFLRLNKITFDENFVYVTKWMTEEKYEIEKIKSINEADMTSLDPFFELEIMEQRGEVKKVDFMPKFFENMTYLLKREYSGQLLELKRRIRALKS
ncbi:MAG: hypothetical protein H6580_05690 [Flammeovirgaceae bacterium]|nr:hypothetical protein [Flammeovirgaceae bacterium]